MTRGNAGGPAPSIEAIAATLNIRLKEANIKIESLKPKVCRWTVGDGEMMHPGCRDRVLDFYWVEGMTYCLYCGGKVEVV